MHYNVVHYVTMTTTAFLKWWYYYMTCPFYDVQHHSIADIAEVMSMNVICYNYIKIPFICWKGWTLYSATIIDGQDDNDVNQIRLVPVLLVSLPQDKIKKLNHFSKRLFMYMYIAV